MNSINEFKLIWMLNEIYLNDFGMKRIYELESIFEWFKIKIEIWFIRFWNGKLEVLKRKFWKLISKDKWNVDLRILIELKLIWFWNILNDQSV